MPTPVYLNVYDLTNHNKYTYWCGVGIYHAGVEVFGTEYAYGGHEFDYTGVFATSPRDPPGQVVFREAVFMGTTDLSQEEVQQLVFKMGYEYKGMKYHLLQKNCNHFASDLVYQLVGRPAPSWINRLAGIAICMHCLLPLTWVPPLLQQAEQGLDQVDPTAANKRLISGHRSDAYSMDRNTPAITSSHSSAIVTPPTAMAGTLLNRA
uniref:PPPDE domain-containing protein n=1 Tax=Chlamydomonas leiostraca TaxID=1034604 RepID=A0A7S0R2E0_9CHLO|mmetsp:Transcript_12219/g.29778  ORF Transcript_12219/g.29778 Transcript_12219/m.29778 type:complete len:207 (+) Transcript_12219:95-715(+)